jgi:hypothetical protein
VKRKTTKDFIQKAKEIHGDKYDYSLVEYIDSKTKLKIICPSHGIFEQKSNQHFNTQGCPKCTIEKTSKLLRNTIDNVISKFNIIHNNKYDYSLINYKNTNTPIDIICEKHGIFKQTPKTHLNGHGCRKCYNEKTSKKLLDDKETFISKASKYHGNKYDYSFVQYVNSHTKVKIRCSVHGIFEQLPYVHIQSSGCPICKESKGEKIIRNFLDENKIMYIRQKTFKDCKYKYLLLFDFYLPDYNICIEFDGEQHFKIKDFFGGEKGFKDIQLRDHIKNDYCKNNKIKLIRIKYNDDIKDYFAIIKNDVFGDCALTSSTVLSTKS